MDFISIFFLLAGISLLRLTYQDVKELMTDERISHYMFGASAVIFLFLDLILLWLFLFLLTSFILAYVKEKPWFKHQNLLGGGDVSIISWVLPALFVLNLMAGFVFIILFLLLTLISIKLTTKSVIPGTIPITISLLLTWFASYFIVV